MIIIGSDECCFLIHIGLSYVLSHVTLKTAMWGTLVNLKELSQREVWVTESQSTLKTSVDKSSESRHLTWPPFRQHSLPRSITASFPATAKVGNLRGVSGSDCLSMSLSSNGSCFLRGTVFSNKCPQSPWPWDLFERRWRVILWESGRIGRTWLSKIIV